MKLSEESFALFLLCSHLGENDADAKPLSTREWDQLEEQLASGTLDLSELQAWSAAQLESALHTTVEHASRLARLLERGSVMQQELNRLEERGIWVITRFDEEFPPRLLERLKRAAPVILYGAGDPRLLKRRGLAVVGSRNVDHRGYALTEMIGSACAESRMTVYSGGARGVDKTAMAAALAAEGTAAGLLADSLEKAVRSTDARAPIEEGRLVLATPYSPNASFNVGMAMSRNKLIYALADRALVIASDAEKGGTWAGAEEALRAGWVPVFVVDGPDAPEGNNLLLKRGAISFPAQFEDTTPNLDDWFDAHSLPSQTNAVQGTLF